MKQTEADSFLVLKREDDESNSQYAYRVLHYNILRLTLVPGHKLNERSLTQKLGISSTPFRQALFRLRTEGLVDIVSQSSTTVSYIDYDLLTENVFIRCTLETAIMEQLCRSGIPEPYLSQIKENLEIQSIYVNMSTGGGKFYELDVAFHRLLFEAAGKSWTFTAMTRSCAQLERVRYINSLSEQTEHHNSRPFFYRSHLELLDTILQGDTSPMFDRIRHHVYGGENDRLKFHSSIMPYIVNLPKRPDEVSAYLL